MSGERLRCRSFFSRLVQSFFLYSRLGNWLVVVVVVRGGSKMIKIKDSRVYLTVCWHVIGR